MKKVDKLKNLL